MIDKMRRESLLASVLTLAVAFGVGLRADRAEARQDAVPKKDEPGKQKRDAEAAGPKATPGGFPVIGEDPPQEFVPLKPRTEQEQTKLDALHDYLAARALEDQRKWTEAIDLLEKVRAKDPESAEIPRRLSRVYFGRGRIEEGVKAARESLKLDPNDTLTISLLIEHFKINHDPIGAERWLKELIADAKLDQTEATYLLVLRGLGDACFDAVAQGPPDDAAAAKLVEEAADAYSKLIDRLDDKTTTRLRPIELARLLGEPDATFKQIGRLLFVARRFPAAIAALRKGLDAAPENVELSEMLAEAQLKTNKPAEALATLEGLLKRRSGGLPTFELLAETLKALKRGDEILPRLEQVIRDDPKNVVPRYLLVDRYRALGKPEKAQEQLDAILKFQDDPQGLAAIAETLRKEKKDVELMKYLDGAVLRGRRPPGVVEQVEDQMRAGNLEAVASVFDRVLPTVEAIVNDPKRADEVLAAGIKLLEAEPPGLGAGGRLVLFYIASKTKHFDSLVAIDRVAAQRDPTLQMTWALHLTLIKAGRLDEAAESLDDFLKKHPDQKNPNILAELSRSLLRVGRNEEALSIANEVLKTQPDNFDAMQLVGICLGRLGKNEEAIEHFKNMLERFPGNDQIVMLVHSNLSMIYVNMNDYAKGEAELEVVLEKNPDDPGVNNDLGYLYADQGKHLERAEAMIRKALDARPDEGAYLDSLGWVLFKRGKAREAVEPLERASKRETADATIFDHLGDVRLQLQEPAKVRAAWLEAERLAAKAKPPDRRLPEIRKKLDALKDFAPAPKPAADDKP